MEKIMLIAGCSHTAGSEIDGSPDSAYNRQHSFGNLLADKLGHKAINIAEQGSPNATICRSVLEWIKNNYDNNTMELFPVVCWSESLRLEIPSLNREHYYETVSPNLDWFSQTNKHYWRFNLGWKGNDPEEKMLIPEYHKFMASNEVYLEIASANYVLQLQYLFKYLNLNYVMCNAMHMFSDNSTHLDFYLSLVDPTKYMHMRDNTKSFYTKYKELGYTNPKATYWHHGEEPHALYADELHNFIKEQ